MTRLWLDDWRNPPPGWHHVRTAPEAIAALERGGVTEISLDYHLGPEEAGTGFDVAVAISWMAHKGTLPRLIWHVHSDDIDGPVRMRRVLDAAEHYWLESEMTESTGEREGGAG